MPTIANPGEVVQADTSSLELKVCNPMGGVELPPILRDTVLSVEGAEAICRILDDSDYPTRAGKEMETVDASILLRKGR